MESISLDALGDFDVEDTAELAELLDTGRRRRWRLSGADARAMADALYNGTDPDSYD